MAVTWMLSLSLSAAWAGTWPDLSEPVVVGGGEDDVALIVAIDDYWAVPDVRGATTNGSDWYRYLVDGRGVAPERVRLLRDSEATVEAMREALTDLAAARGADGTSWVVFVGHGALEPSGGDQLLLGADVQATASSLVARSLRRSEIEAALPDAVMVLDSCFSGLTPDGTPLVPGLQPLVPSWALPSSGPSTVLAAGRGQQLAGPLPWGDRPAFSYLVLGALRGWGDVDGGDVDGVVTAGEAVGWARRALQATLVGRSQEPLLAGPDRPLALVGDRDVPDLGAIVVAQAPERRATSVRLPRPPDLAGITSGRTDDLELERLMAVALVRQDDGSSAGAKERAWRDVLRHRDGEHTYRAQAEAAANAWSEVSAAELELEQAYEREYRELRRFLATDEVPLVRRQAVVDGFLGRWGEVRAEEWHLGEVQRVRTRLAEDGEGELPEYGLHQDDIPGGMGPFFWGWDKSLIAHGGVVPFRFGVPVLLGDAPEVGVDGQLALGATVGPVDFGLAGLTLVGLQSSMNVYLGVQPFAVRRRYQGGYHKPGEIKGSVINPMVGLGARFGFDKTAQYLDLYVADHLFLTNSLGLRLEYRIPVAAMNSGTVLQEMEHVFVPSVVLTPRW
jgi:hypothetical protein